MLGFQIFLPFLSNPHKYLESLNELELYINNIKIYNINMILNVFTWKETVKTHPEEPTESKLDQGVADKRRERMKKKNLTSQ